MPQSNSELPMDKNESKMTQMMPIDRSIFNKMLFCERIFEFIELEESLYFTALDIELHSKGKDEQVDLDSILETNCKHLSAMSVNLKEGEKVLSGAGTVNPVQSTEEVDKIIE